MRDDDDIFDPYGSSRRGRRESGDGSGQDDVLSEDVFESDSKPRVKKPSSSSSSNWLVGLLVLVLVLLAGFGIALSLQDQRQQLAPRAEEDAEVKFAQAAAAFDGEPADLNDPRVAELSDLIDDMRIAYRDRDAMALGDVFDCERMLQEILRISDVRLSNTEFEQGLNGLQTGLPQSLLLQAEQAVFERFEVKRVEFDTGGSEALCYVKQWASNGFVSKLRFWAIRDEDRWRIYDFEDLSVSMRASDLMSLFIGHVERDMSKLIQFEVEVGKLNAAIAAIGVEDIETARTQLAAIQTSSLPGTIQAVKYLMDAGVALYDYEFEVALQHLTRAQALHSDLLAASLMRAMALNGLARHDEALAEAQKFLDKLGGDPDASLEAAIALQGLNRPDEALVVMRAGLDEDPSSIELFLRLAQSLPVDQAAEAGERFLQIPDGGQWLSYIENSLWYNADVSWAIASAYLNSHPDDVTALYYGADSLLKLGRHKEVLALLGPVVESNGLGEPLDFLTQDELSTTDLAWLYHRAVVAAGDWSEVYQSSRDKPATFEMLAQEMAYDESLGLRELVAMHAVDFPDDARLGAHQATIAIWDADWETAIELLRVELENTADKLQQPAIRYRLINAMFNAGRAMEALQTLTPQDEVFSSLMWQASSADPPQLDLLEELLAAHSTEHSEALGTKYWSIRIPYQREEYDQALALLEAHRDVLSADEQYGWEIEDLKFSCLIHLERFDEAKALADDQAEQGYPLYGAQLAAAQGNVAETESWLERCRELGYTEWEFYDAEFLGDQLRSETFAALREKYPEPQDLVDPLLNPPVVD